MQDEKIRQIAERYMKRMGKDYGPGADYTKLYEEFIEEEAQRFKLKVFFEKFCRFSSKIFGFLSFGKKYEDETSEQLEIGGLNISARDVSSAVILTFVLTLVSSFLLAFMGFVDGAFFVFCSGIFLSFIVYLHPKYRKDVVILISEQESVLAVLYMSVYLRFNPEMENAVLFAADHLDGPLGKELKQILWLMESEKVATLEEGVQIFIPLWSKRNDEFVRAFTTFFQIKQQGSEERRSEVIERALESILSGTYSKMDRFARDLQMPVVMLQSFGLMLPLIALILFPILSIFLSDKINVSYLFFGYIIVLPLLILFLSNRIMSKRPGAFMVPKFKTLSGLPPLGKIRFTAGGVNYDISAWLIALFATLVIMTPGIIYISANTLPLYEAVQSGGFGSSVVYEAFKGEYELPAVMFALTIPLGIAVGAIIYFWGRSHYYLKMRDNIEAIEDELADLMLYFSNQFASAKPVEIAVGNIITEYKRLNLSNMKSYLLLYEIENKMLVEGKTFSQAIKSKEIGIMEKYPSPLLDKTLFIIAEGSKKGTAVLFNVTSKISRYLDNMKKVKTLIYQLLSETTSSINLQGKFMVALIAGIVSGMTVVMIKALATIGEQITQVISKLNFGVQLESSDVFTKMFDLSSTIPPTIFQVLIGVYVVETVILLAILSSGIAYGFDNLKRDAAIVKNLIYSTVIYCAVTLIMVAFFGDIVSSNLVR